MSADVKRSVVDELSRRSRALDHARDRRDAYVVYARHVGDLTLREIAAAAGLSVEGVRKMVARVGR